MRFVGVCLKRPIGFEMQIALDVESARSRDGSYLRKRDAADLRRLHTEVTKPESNRRLFGVDFGEEPRSASPRAKEFHYGRKVNGAAVRADALGVPAPVFDQLPLLFFGKEIYGFTCMRFPPTSLRLMRCEVGKEDGRT